MCTQPGLAGRFYQTQAPLSMRPSLTLSDLAAFVQGSGGLGASDVSPSPFLYPGTDISNDPPLFPSQVFNFGNLLSIWSGFFVAPNSAIYQIGLAADDGGSVFVDGQAVVPLFLGNSPADLTPTSSSIWLSAGYHPITVVQTNSGDLSFYAALSVNGALADNSLLRSPGIGACIGAVLGSRRFFSLLF